MQILETTFDVINITVSAPERIDGHEIQRVTIQTKEGQIVITCHLAN